MNIGKSIGHTVEEKLKERRVKRAHALADAGLVNRSGDRFLVSSRGLAGRNNPYEVRRDESGKIRCTCLEFEESVDAAPDFRCEHILAVKFAIAAKNTEPVTKLKRDVSSKTNNATESSLLSAPRQAEPGDATAPVPCAADLKVLSGDGEQISAEIKADETTCGHVVSNEAGFAAAANLKGENTMIENESAVTLSPFVEPGLAGNVLEFNAARPSERRATNYRENSTLRLPLSATSAEHNAETDWFNCVEILERSASDWSCRIRNLRQIGEMIILTATITVNGVSRESLGSARSDDPVAIHRAEVSAMTQTALKFGFVRDAVLRRASDPEVSSVIPAARQFPENPMAKTLSDLVTAKQLGLIRAMGRETGLDAKAECYRLLMCYPDELSRAAASAFIAYLKEASLAGESDISAARRAM